MDFVKRLPKKEPDFIAKQANVGAAGRAIDALVSHVAVPKAVQMGLLGAGAGGVGGFIAGGDGNRLQNALTGALIGGAAGAGGGYMLGRRQAGQMLPDLSKGVLKVDDFASPTLGGMRRQATQLGVPEQRALKDSIKSYIEKGQGESIIPVVEDVFSLPGILALGAGGAGGVAYGRSQNKGRSYGRGYGYGPPPPPRFGYGRPY